MNLLECVEQQLSELEILQSIYPNQNEVDIRDRSTFSAMRAYAESDGKSFPPNKMLPITLNIDLEENKGKLIVEITLPLTYPFESLPVVFLRLDKLSRQSQQIYNEELNKHIDTLSVGECCLYQIVQWATENVPAIATQAENLKPENLAEENPKTSTFTRLWIYSHHIYNKVKRKSILEWAKELDLTGFSMPGKPGIVCVEGTQDKCEEYWQRLRRQTWKRLMVIHREDVSLTDPQCINEHRKFKNILTEMDFGVHGGRDYHMDLGKFLEFLNEHDSRPMFSILFGVEGKMKEEF